LKRAAVIFHRFGPYHLARLTAAAERCAILAIEEAAESAEYAWDEVGHPGANLQRITLLGKNERPRRPAAEIARRLYAVLEREAPDTLFIPGWSDPAGLAALDWALASNVPVVIMSETTRLDVDRRASKEFLKSRVVKLCSAALVGGKPQAQYMEELGMSADRIFTGYNAVDNDYFARRAAEIRNSKFEIRKQYGLPENYFLASARFLERKNLMTLIRAYASYHSRHVHGLQRPWDLVILGDGPLRPTLDAQLSSLKLRSHVLLPGFKQYDKLPFYYGLASAFVHASLSEAWGLVVNEAMASSLPVIVSRQCGCSRDLVPDGESGFQFDATNQHALEHLLLRVASMPPTELQAMGERGRKIVAGWSPQNFARQFELAGETSHKDFCKRASVVTSLLLRALIRCSNAEAARLLPSTAAPVAV
jgi:1,2-diacylglycerol 3-alpha-glucosyltransferase